MKIKFVDGTTVEYTYAESMVVQHDGAQRSGIAFRIPQGVISVEELARLCTEDNLERLELINEADDAVNVYDGYVLLYEAGLRSVPVQNETVSLPASSEMCIVLTLARRTYAEQTMKEMQRQFAEMQARMSELGADK